MLTTTLTKGEVRALSKALKRHKLKLPPIGYVQKIPVEEREALHDQYGSKWAPTSVVHDFYGYFYMYG